MTWPPPFLILPALSQWKPSERVSRSGKRDIIACAFSSPAISISFFFRVDQRRRRRHYARRCHHFKLLILSHTIAFILATFPAVLVVCRSVIHTHSRTHFICWYYHPLLLLSPNSFGFKWKLYIFLFNLLVFIKSKCDCCLPVCSVAFVNPRPADRLTGTEEELHCFAPVVVVGGDAAAWRGAIWKVKMMCHQNWFREALLHFMAVVVGGLLVLLFLKFPRTERNLASMVDFGLRSVMRSNGWAGYRQVLLTRYLWVFNVQMKDLADMI